MSNFKIGDIVEGQVTGLTKYGIFVSLEDTKYFETTSISDLLSICSIVFQEFTGTVDLVTKIAFFFKIFVRRVERQIRR